MGLLHGQVRLLTYLTLEHWAAFQNLFSSNLRNLLKSYNFVYSPLQSRLRAWQMHGLYLFEGPCLSLGISNYDWSAVVLTLETLYERSFSVTRFHASCEHDNDLYVGSRSDDTSAVNKASHLEHKSLQHTGLENVCAFGKQNKVVNLEWTPKKHNVRVNERCQDRMVFVFLSIFSEREPLFYSFWASLSRYKSMEPTASI